MCVGSKCKLLDWLLFYQELYCIQPELRVAKFFVRLLSFHLDVKLAASLRGIQEKQHSIQEQGSK